MKIYQMYRVSGEAYARVVHGAAFRPRLRHRLDLANHSPTGFEWGYAGSGPAQLALAILADCLDDDAQALSLYQRFKSQVVATKPRDEGWSISEETVRYWVGRQVTG